MLKIDDQTGSDIFVNSILYILIHSLVFSPRGRACRNQSPVMWPLWLWHTASLGKSLGVVCHCFPPPLDLPTFEARCLYVRNDARYPSSEKWNCGRENCPIILPKFRLPRKFRVLLHDANLRDGTDGFYFPSEGRCAEEFFALKRGRFRPGLNPRTWVLKASTLPLNHTFCLKIKKNKTTYTDYKYLR